MKKTFLLIVLIMVPPLFAACSHLNPSPRNLTPAQIPASFSLYGGSGEQMARWGHSLGSDELSKLIDLALEESFSLKQSWARLSQVKASAVKAGAGIYPEVSVTGDGSRQWLRQKGATGSRSSETTSLSLGVAGSYELDLWGRIRSSRESQELEVVATQLDLNAAAMTLTAEVATRWVNMIARRKQLDLLGQQLESSLNYLELVELRFRKSLASALDVFQQREAVAKLRAALPLVKAQEKLLGHELALLLGKPTSSGLFPDAAEFPELGAIPDTGLPADLLANRPDVRAAGLRLYAADWSVSAARADRLPAIRLTAATSVDGDQVSTLFDNWLTNLAGSLTGPVFDGGRRRAEVDRTRAVVEERLQQYRQTVFTAIKEVEDALVQEEKQREHLRELKKELSFARQGLDEARVRYIKGLSDYLPVLTELQAEQRLEHDLIQKEAQLIVYRISLHRSLGGMLYDSKKSEKKQIL